MPDNLYQSILAWQSSGLVAVEVLEDLSKQALADPLSKRVRITPTPRGLALHDFTKHPKRPPDMLYFYSTGQTILNTDFKIEVVSGRGEDLRRVEFKYDKYWLKEFVDHSRIDPLQTAPVETRRIGAALLKREPSTGAWDVVVLDTANHNQPLKSRIESYLRAPR